MKVIGLMEKWKEKEFIIMMMAHIIKEHLRMIYLKEKVNFIIKTEI